MSRKLPASDIRAYEISDLLNIKLVVEYDGSGYSGWQRQSDKPSVQEKIEKAISVLFGLQNIKLYGAGRTDAGVHAFGQAANFRVSRAAFEKLGIDRFQHSINAILPPDIAVKSTKIAAESFHARYSAKARIYKYYFAQGKRAVEGAKIFEVNYDIDLETAAKFCRVITGAHSFKSLCKNKTDDHDFFCMVEYAKLKKNRGGIYELEIKANRFLHSMVRAVVGALLKTSSGKLKLSEFREKFRKGDEIKIQFVPAKALFLSKVIY
ncbi:MAG TPA: tRNA pseudouridine(38-40) synthase TruA [Ignavibacteria bacterium]|nr:tRNA pseudouridine(38-40) synthase TruA [Ignavibacteria bacterium]